MRNTLLVAIAGLLTLAFAVFLSRSWLESHDDRLRLSAALDAQKQIIAAADSRERDRASELRDVLEKIAALKHATQTPEQILRALPQSLPLPEPIKLQAEGQGTAISGEIRVPATAGKPHPCPESARGPGAEHDAEFDVSASLLAGCTPNAGSTEQVTAPAPKTSGKGIAAHEGALPDAVLPAADLKPLFDFVQDCRACQAQLAAARADLRDQQTRSTALTAERDAALRAAKGGGFWLRVKRNTKWFTLGAAAGAGIALSRSH